MDLKSTLARMDIADQAAAIACLTAYFRDGDTPRSLAAFDLMTRQARHALIEYIGAKANQKGVTKYERDD